jgi:Bacterial regulatory proteins, tetR family
VPRAGLTGHDVVAAAAGLAEQIGYQGVTMGLLADRLGVRLPSLYKDVGGLADRRHRLATLSMTELGEVIGFIDRGLRPARANPEAACRARNGTPSAGQSGPTAGGPERP